MKQFSSLLLTAIICMLIFISCGKDSNPDNSNSTSDSIYLDKAYDLYDNGAGLDTQNIFMFNYDNLKRLNSITAIVHDADNVNLYYYYNGNNMLPYKTIYTDEFSLGIDSEVVYHYYDGNNKKLKDSTIEIDYTGAVYAVSVINYAYTTGKMIGTTLYDDGSSITYYRDTALLDANNNITNSNHYIFDGSNYNLYSSAQFTYDNKINPFSKLNIHESLTHFPNGETLFWELKCFNNILVQHETTYPPNPYTFDLSYTYTYNANMLPATNSTGSGADMENEIYTYKNL